MKKNALPIPDLFAALPEPPRMKPPADPATCAHRGERKTETDWGAPWGVRLTWTCACGRVRGRVEG